jgi:hypothetical protein
VRAQAGEATSAGDDCVGRAADFTAIQPYLNAVVPARHTPAVATPRAARQLAVHHHRVVRHQLIGFDVPQARTAMSSSASLVARPRITAR